MIEWLDRATLIAATLGLFLIFWGLVVFVALGIIVGICFGVPRTIGAIRSKR
jgi:Na+/citrate or Na+/malate symporter